MADAAMPTEARDPDIGRITASFGLWDYAIRSGAVQPDSPPAKEHDPLLALLLPGVFLLTVPVAFWDAEIASMMWALLFATRFVRRRQVGRRVNS